jgi:hypothetical protein
VAKPKLILDYVYDHEAKLADRVYLTQPTGGGQVIDYTWRQTLDQARRMAAHIKAQGLEPGARIALLSKNCAHFFMAELAIWMAGCTTVAIFPTETAETISYVLEHSGASLLFVGKLDTWPAQKPGVPATLPCISFPLAPKNSYEQWDAITGRTPPLTGRVTRDGKDIAILLYTSGSTGTPKGVSSGQTGRSVMAAAAQNLCPVTLELGGKAPAIVLDDFPLRKAAERILYVKLLNAGQICTTVDHAWLPEDKINEFVQMAKEIVPARYANMATVDYTSIIDQRAFERLIHALDDARERGATLINLLPGAPYDAATRKINPTIVLNAPQDSILLQREIFGPILPLRGFTQLDTVVTQINAGPRPLAIYPFSYNSSKVQMLLDRVMSGGVSVNDALFHVAQHDLPFGGVGGSGMGHYHGHEGFITFSKLRPVFYQARFSALKFMAPPYGKFADRMLAFMAK